MEYSPLTILFSLLPFFILMLSGVFYLLFSCGLYAISSRRKIQFNWLSWIPVGQLYVLGTIAKKSLNIPRMDLVLPISILALFFLIWVPFFGGVLLTAYLILVIAFMILLIGSLYSVYQQYSPDRVLLYTILSCIGLAPVIVFVIRDKTPVETERAA